MVCCLDQRTYQGFEDNHLLSLVQSFYKVHSLRTEWAKSHSERFSQILLLSWRFFVRGHDIYQKVHQFQSDWVKGLLDLLRLRLCLCVFLWWWGHLLSFLLSVVFGKLDSPLLLACGHPLRQFLLLRLVELDDHLHASLLLCLHFDRGLVNSHLDIW